MPGERLLPGRRRARAAAPGEGSVAAGVDGLGTVDEEAAAEGDFADEGSPDPAAAAGEEQAGDEGRSGK